MATKRGGGKSPHKTRALTGIAVDPSLRGRGPAPGAPNAGRPPSALREVYRMAAEERRHFLLEVIDGTVEGASVGDRVKAWDLLNKYGGMASVEVTVAPKLVNVDV